MAEFRFPRGRGPRVHGGWSWRTRRFTMCTVAALPVILVTACSNLGPDTTAAAGAATAFHHATQDGDGTAACALLAPATIQDLESTTGQPCPDAVLAQDLPDAHQVQDSAAFGRGAQVLMDGDVVFLSMFGDQWLVTAAGCQPRGDRPYDCTLKGG